MGLDLCSNREFVGLVIVLGVWIVGEVLGIFLCECKRDVTTGIGEVIMTKDLEYILGKIGGFPVIARVAQMSSNRYVIYLPKNLNTLWKLLKEESTEIEIIIRPISTRKNN